MGEDAEDQVRKWAESSGAALELRVAAAFRKRLGEPSVDHGLHYPTESSSTGMREVDVVARAWVGRHFTNGVPDIGLIAVIECKAYKKAPWVLFEADEKLVRKGHEFLSYLPRWRSDQAPELEAIETFGLRLLAPLAEAHAYQGTVAAQQRDEDRNIAWDAVRQVLAATDAVRRAQPPGKPRLTFFLPIIVVSAPLFALKLDGSGDLVPRRVSMMPMLSASTFRLQAPSLLRRSSVPHVSQLGLWVVNEDHIDDLADAVVKAAKEVRVRDPG